MKAKTVGLLSMCGMLLTSVSVYSLTPEGSITRDSVPVSKADTTTESVSAADEKPTEAWTFTDGDTLMVEGRVGHSRLLTNGANETFVMLDVSGDAQKTSASAPVNLSLVIDRSGSMKGKRLENAQQAAVTAVQQLRDGDVVSVITFDTQTRLEVAPTVIGPGVRERIAGDIRRIQLGGDTCISCGIEEGLAELARNASGKVNRIILLSDGDANSGIRDIPGFRSLARRAVERGTTLTTIGVDVHYNEQILAALAQDGNGRHHFVENASDLPRVFQSEADALTRTVASDVFAEVELAPGVELVQVFDRSFSRSGNRIRLAMGAFSAGENKTVLMKVRSPRGSSSATAVQPLADVRLSFSDLAEGKPGSCSGRLGVELVDDPSAVSEIDPVVAGRVHRSLTADALKTANNLFNQGKSDLALERLRAQKQELQSIATKAKASAPKKAAAKVALDFDDQALALDEAEQSFAAPPAASPFGGGFATPPQDSREGKAAVRRNQEAALDFAF